MHSEAVTILRRCEEDLRSLLARASHDGDYESVMWLAAAAKQIGRLASIPVPESDLGSQPSESSLGEEKSARPPLPGSDEYPRYTRVNGTLIKTGWSKRAKAEYRHKAPSAVLMTITEAVLLAGADGRVFAASDIVTDLVDDDGQTVPDYQAYLCLGLLKQHGLLDQHGRTGYSIPRPESLLSAVQEAWNELPSEASR